VLTENRDDRGSDELVGKVVGQHAQLNVPVEELGAPDAAPTPDIVLVLAVVGHVLPGAAQHEKHLRQHRTYRARVPWAPLFDHRLARHFATERVDLGEESLHSPGLVEVVHQAVAPCLL
jgi:hypothetical protein